MRVEGAIRTARPRREPGHRSAQAVPRPPDDRSDGHATVLWRGPASLHVCCPLAPRTARPVAHAWLAGRALFSNLVAHEHITAATVKPGEPSVCFRCQILLLHPFLESTRLSLSILTLVYSQSLVHVATPATCSTPSFTAALSDPRLDDR